MTAVMNVSNAATVSPTFQLSMFLRIVSSLPFSVAAAAQLAISVFTSSSNEPFFAIAAEKSSRRSASFDSLAFACTITLTAKRAALPSPFSKMFKSSASAKLPTTSPLMLNDASTSFSACSFASAKDIFFLATKFITRSYSNSVSTLMFTFLRSLRFVNAWSVSLSFVFLPVTSLR